MGDKIDTIVEHAAKYGELMEWLHTNHNDILLQYLKEEEE